jgi:hypothetical protein
MRGDKKAPKRIGINGPSITHSGHISYCVIYRDVGAQDDSRMLDGYRLLAKELHHQGGFKLHRIFQWLRILVLIF